MKTLLIVEDDGDIQDYYQILLGGLGLRLLRAGSGKEALGLIDGGEAVDLVLLDVVLPGMYGEELFRALRVERGSAVPVIVCTVEERLVEAFRRIGAIQGLFIKGESGSGLVDQIRGQLGI